MFSVPRTKLTPIPEECLGNPDRESARAPCEPSNADRSEEKTDGSCERMADDRSERAAKRAAAKRELPARHSVMNGWPADREVTEVRGRVTLRASADPQAESMRAVCRWTAVFRRMGVAVFDLRD